jgi:cytochrome o ubiquinol oxidase subunit 1
LFGIFAGVTYWFPKVTGFKLNERLGRYAFWLWLVGFLTSFIPLYILGLMGATRRLDHYDASLGWQWLFGVALFGSLIIVAAVTMQVLQVVVSIRQRQQLRDTTGDPWNGKSLEWATASPPAPYNFAVIPVVTSRDAFLEMKQQGMPKPVYQDIHMPKNTGAGIYISAFLLVFGFAMVWHLYWLAIITGVGAIISFMIRAFDDETEYTITAAEVEKMEASRGI